MAMLVLTRLLLLLLTMFPCCRRATAARVLDLFVLDRWPALLRVAVAVLQELAPRLLLLDLEGILRAMHFPRQLLFGLSIAAATTARRAGVHTILLLHTLLCCASKCTLRLNCTAACWLQWPTCVCL
jgi:hypothetical protein